MKGMILGKVVFCWGVSALSLFGQVPFFPYIGLASSDSAADKACGVSCPNGTMYIRTTDNVVRYKSNSVWREVSSGSGSGAVSSVFGRTGDVTAQTGDYAFSNISGTVSTGQLPNLSGDVSGGYGATVVGKLQGRTVTNTNPSNGQVLVWNTNQWEPQNQTASSNATQLQSRNISANAPSDGQVLTWSNSNNDWRPITPSGGAGSLDVFNIERTSGTLLTIGGSCTSINPCVSRFNETVYQMVSSATVTISGGSGTALVYLKNDGNMYVGHNGLTLACNANCVVEGSISAFPVDSIPLYSWSATSAIWDVSGKQDYRAYVSRNIGVAGLGINIVSAGNSNTYEVNTAVVQVKVAPPANAASNCSVGEFAVDTNFRYECVATNTWRRVGISTW